MLHHHIQPYELLGVTINSSLDDLRKRYYHLALLCHPDKGGSGNDMITLHNAFKWVEQQLRAIDDKEHHSYESAQESFDAFLKTQHKQEVLPSMAEIALASIGSKRTDITEWFWTSAPHSLRENDGSACAWFEQMVMRDIYLGLCQGSETQLSLDTACHRVLKDMHTSWETLQPPCISGGYGEWMTQEEESQKQVLPLGRKEIVVYTEQQPYVPRNPRGAVNGTLPSALDDYSISTNRLDGYDYKEAFSLPLNDQENFDETMSKVFPGYKEPLQDVEEQLKKAKAERTLMDTTVEDVQKGFIRLACTSDIPL